MQKRTISDSVLQEKEFFTSEKTTRGEIAMTPEERVLLLKEAIEKQTPFVLTELKINSLRDEEDINLLIQTIINAANLTNLTENTVRVVVGCHDVWKKTVVELTKKILEGIYPGGIESGGDKGFNVYSMPSVEGPTTVVIEPPEEPYLKKN